MVTFNLKVVFEKPQNNYVVFLELYIFHSNKYQWINVKSFENNSKQMFGKWKLNKTSLYS